MGGPQMGPAAPRTARPAASPLAGFRFDLARLSQADRITGVATLALFITLFLPWYSLSAGPFGSLVWIGLSGNSFLWLVLLICLAIIAFLVLSAGLDRLPFALPLGREMILLIATGVNLLLTLIAFFLIPDGFLGTGWSVGAFLGLIAAIAACVPVAVPAIQSTTRKA